MTDRTYLLHGLRVRSPIPLAGRPVEPTTGCELEILLGPTRTIPPIPPVGEPEVDHRTGERRWYSAARTSTGHVLRFHGVADFEVSEDLTTVVCRPGPTADHGLISVFLAGTVLAYVLCRRGEPVLHASAVAWDGRAVAFVGPSGSGKTTLAALLCSQGASLVADDVLRADLGHPVRCHAGNDALRLRGGMRDLGHRFVDAISKTTADGRTAIVPTSTTAGLLPLAAVVRPHLDRSAGEVSLTRIDPVDATILVATAPRVLGWVDRGVVANEFRHAANLASAVPVYTAVVPWTSSPPSPVVGAALAAALRQTLGSPEPVGATQ